MGIEAKGALEGSLNYSEIKGEINNGIEKIYPELEDLEVTPSTEEQNFKSRKYGYDNVKVKAIESETLTISPTKLPQTHTGLYDTVNVNGSYDLESQNIVRGKTIFGVAGTFDGVDTSDANATSSDIKMSKTAYVNGMKITGDFNGVDTSDATATAGDIKMGKTAYVDNEKVIGTYEGIIPTGTKSITTNGIHDVTQYAEANVNVPAPSPNLQSKSVTITENTTTNISADAGYDGLSSVAVTTNVSGGGSAYNTEFDSTVMSQAGNGNYNQFYNFITYVNLNGYDFTNISGFRGINRLFYGCANLMEIDIKNANLTTIQSMQGMFAGCTSLKSIDFTGCVPDLCTNFQTMFLGCSMLENIVFSDSFKSSKNGGTTMFTNMFQNCSALTNTGLNNILGFLKNAPSSYSGTKTLKQVGLTSAQATTCTTLSNWPALSALGWTTGY